MAFYHSVTGWQMLWKLGPEASYTGLDQWCFLQSYHYPRGVVLEFLSLGTTDKVGEYCSGEGLGHHRTFSKTIGFTHSIQGDLFLPQAVIIKSIFRHSKFSWGQARAIKSHRGQVYLASDGHTAETKSPELSILLPPPLLVYYHE